MSLILEALKKSESRRRLGEAPDLGTPFTVTRRRRSPLPLIVILIVVAAGLGWWYVRTPPPSGDTAGARSAQPGPATGTNSTSAQRVGQPAGNAPAPRDAATVQPRSNSAATAPAMTISPTGTRPTGANASIAPQPAPGTVSDLQAVRTMNRRLPTPPSPTSAPATPNASPPSTPASPPLTRATTPTAPAPTLAKSPPDSNGAKPVSAQEPRAAPDFAPKPTDGAESLPLYYELAYNVRKDIPPFGLSMHVFAADAAGRFVVVDGERKVEGDAIKEGLVLREVRPDGMVLEFRGQRFFYPRPGH